MKPWLLLLILASPPVLADEAVFFRCTAADGALTIQSVACPPGSEQRIQRIATPTAKSVAITPEPNAGAPAAAPVNDASALQPMTRPVLQAGTVDVEPTYQILDSQVLRREAQEKAATEGPAKPPLPAIYQCQSADGSRFLHELEPAPPHCVLLQVSGLGGNTPLNAASCEVIRDDCAPIADAQRCASWQQRFRDARGRERFATPDNQAAAVAERERLQALLAGSDCAVPE